MSIKTEIDRISSNIENAYIALNKKGATMPDVMNSKNLKSTIETISSTDADTVDGFHFQVLSSAPTENNRNMFTAVVKS